MSEFGDLSGLVFNLRTGRLVCGHQRRKQLPEDTPIEDYQEATDDSGTVGYAWVPLNGTRFRARFVDWPETKEKAANLAANNPAIQGKFTSALADILDELDLALPNLASDLQFDILALEIPPVPPPQEGIPVDSKEQWQDMPEFQQKNHKPWKTILVHLLSSADLPKFAKAVKQQLTDRTKYLYFPALKDTPYWGTIQYKDKNDSK